MMARISDSVQRSSRARWLWIAFLVTSLVCIGLWAVYLRPTPVQVTLMDGQIQVQPGEVRWVKSSIRFFVENNGPDPHQFILIRIHKPAHQIPVRDGVAQFFSESDDPAGDDPADIDSWTAVIYDGFQNGGFSMPGPQKNPPLGPPLAAGEKRVVNYGIPTMGISPQTLTILCNLPGHYERGEYAAFSIIE